MGLLAMLFGGEDLIPTSLKKRRKPFVPYVSGKQRKPFFTRKRMKRVWGRVTFKKTRRTIKRARRNFRRFQREYRYFKGQTPQAIARRRGLAQAHRRRRSTTVQRPTRRR